MKDELIEMLENFRKEEKELYINKDERFSTPIAKSTSIRMLKLIDELEKELIKTESSKNEISPYNPAHINYGGNCCGIFNIINDDGELICNECGMTIDELCSQLKQ